MIYCYKNTLFIVIEQTKQQLCIASQRCPYALGGELPFAIKIYWLFYDSKTFELISEGIADMHCMSDEYLVDELIAELKQ